MRIGKRHIGWAALAALGAAAVFWFTAPYNIAASVPHFPGVSPLLHGYMHNAVRVRSFGAEPPAQMDLDGPALIRLGAAHFASGCATCHGAPGVPRNPIATEMTPEPTPIHEVSGLGAGSYHWIVANGIKYSGMPAWAGAHRDDEPWALAAFLRAYDDLTPAEYRELAFGGAAGAVEDGAAHRFGTHRGGLSLTESCARCHGKDGQGRDGTAPRLAGQSRSYLRAALDAYAAEERQSGIMEPAAASLGADERADLAAHYAEKPAFAPDTPGEPALRERGAELARRGDEHEDIPACLGCHGAEREPTTPIISGQSELWLVTWLKLWRERPHPAVGDGAKMHAAARGLGDADIRALAAYFTARRPDRRREEARAD